MDVTLAGGGALFSHPAFTGQAGLRRKVRRNCGEPPHFPPQLFAALWLLRNTAYGPNADYACLPTPQPVPFVKQIPIGLFLDTFPRHFA